jgi:pimeloyl-ACP methyl ester carboxylesterase
MDIEGRGRGAVAATVVLCALAAGGCGASSGDSGGATTTAPRTASTATAPEPAAGGRTVRFRATDGVALHGTLTPAGGGRAPAVVLVHQYQGGPEQWQPMIPYLHKAGYVVLNYASRSPDELDETILARDARGAIAELRREPGVDPQRVAILGASIGASTAAWVAGRRPDQRLRAAVGLSPAESGSFFDAGDKGTFRPHDLLLIADSGELVEAKGIKQDAGGRGVTVKQSEQSGHGVELIADPTVRDAVIAWLDARMR